MRSACCYDGPGEPDGEGDGQPAWSHIGTAVQPSGMQLDENLKQRFAGGGALPHVNASAHSRGSPLTIAVKHPAYSVAPDGVAPMIA